jgi:dipeptidyl aminopeptidase/acylaminoacyl peptidase
MKQRRVVLLIPALVATLLTVGCERKVRVAAPTIERLTNVVNEIMSVGEFYRSPEPNHKESLLSFVRWSEGGQGLFQMEFATGIVKRIPHEPRVQIIFTWSPDDHFLLLKDSVIGTGLRVYDCQSDSFRPIDKESSFAVGQIDWLGTNRLAYISKNGKNAELRLLTLGESHKSLRTFPNPGTMDWMTPISDHRIAYLENKEIWSIDVDSGEATQLTTNLCSQYLWLNFSKENKEFLFCWWDKSEWRHLFRLDSTGSLKLTQLTFGPEHSYNGQWIQKGTGIAYVAHITNHFYLAVRPKNASQSTNLFAGGHVIAYRVSDDGEKIYAAAAIGMEPPRIWRYVIKDLSLTSLVTGTNAPFINATIAQSTEEWVKSFDGLAIPYYLLRPPNLETGRKYPVVIAIPPESGQFVQAWEKYGQFIANLGAYYVAVNPRGSDGYGLTFRQKHDGDAYRDILAVRKRVLENPNADSDHVFLITWSNGSKVADNLATKHPGLWDGVILISGQPPDISSRSPKLPRYLLFMGDADSPARVNRSRLFAASAKTNGVAVRLLTDRKTGHHVTDVNVDKRIGSAIAEFMYRTNYTKNDSGVSHPD